MSRPSRHRARHQQQRGVPRHEFGLSAHDGGEPERLLLDQIAGGELDHHLVAIAQAVRARQELLHTISSHKALAMLTVGDQVRINDNASPQYLRGVYGVIVGLDQYAAIIRLHRPVGRFGSGEIRCPPLALDRLSPAS